MPKYAWSSPITVFVIVGGLYCGPDDDSGQSSTDAQADGTDYAYQCPEGSEQHTTSSDKTVCCPSDNSQFCYENADGYTGGCWPEGTDCNTITECDGQFASCPYGSLPYCNDNSQLTCHVCPEDASVNYTTSGKPVCCETDFPAFCDERSDGYPGGCWQAGVDCATIALCGDTWRACGSGTVVVCEEATGQHYCDQS